MQRDSSTSDWEFVDAPTHTVDEVGAGGTDRDRGMRRDASSFNETDFFSSDHFHRISSQGEWSPVGDEFAKPQAAVPVAEKPSRRGEVHSDGSDADVDPSPVQPHHRGGKQSPPHMNVGFPSSASVDSIFNAGAFSHFSPQKFQSAAKHNQNSMRPSFSSSSVATPTSPPPQAANYVLGAAVSLATPQQRAVDRDLQQQQQLSAAADYSFRTSEVPKLDIAGTRCKSDVVSPHEGTLDAIHVAGRWSPRLPSIICAAACDPSSNTGCTLRTLTNWSDPTESLVTGAVAMLILDVIRRLFADDTWVSCAGKTTMLVMVMGALAAFVNRNEAGVSTLVTSSTLGERVRNTLAQRRDAVAGAASDFWWPFCSHLAPISNMLDGAIVVGAPVLAVEALVGRSPMVTSSATQLSDCAIFWLSFWMLHVPFRHACLSQQSVARRLTALAGSDMVWQMIVIDASGWFVLQVLFGTCALIG